MSPKKPQKTAKKPPKNPTNQTQVFFIKRKLFLEEKIFISVYRKIQLWGDLGSPSSQRAWNIPN